MLSKKSGMATKRLVLRGSERFFETVSHAEANPVGNLRYLMLNLPFECNYDCLKCCNIRKSGSVGGKPLEIWEISGIIKEAGKLGVKTVVLAGEGEPMLNKNWMRIVSEASENGLIPYIFTNGSTLVEKNAEFLKNAAASLIVNIDSLQQRTYEKLSGIGGSFKKLMKNLEITRRTYAETKEEFGEYGIRRLAINTVISNENAAELFQRGGVEPLREFCGDDFVLVYNSPFLKGNASENAEIFSMRSDLSEKLSANMAGNIPLGTTLDGKWCAYMRNGISVGACGEILTCAYSLESAGAFGNVREGGLAGAIGKVNIAVDEFYLEKGQSRCILRHPLYSEFVRLAQEAKSLAQRSKALAD